MTTTAEKTKAALAKKEAAKPAAKPAAAKTAPAEGAATQPKKRTDFSRRSPEQLVSDLEAKKVKILQDSEKAIAKIDAQIVAIHGRAEKRLKAAKLVSEGVTLTDLEREEKELQDKLKALRETKQAVKTVTEAGTVVPGSAAPATPVEPSVTAE